ncbi:MAG: hypothetical protein WCI61_01435 [Chloroflexota bacterium]
MPMSHSGRRRLTLATFLLTASLLAGGHSRSVEAAAPRSAIGSVDIAPGVAGLLSPESRHAALDVTAAGVVLATVLRLVAARRRAHLD